MGLTIGIGRLNNPLLQAGKSVLAPALVERGILCHAKGFGRFAWAVLGRLLHRTGVSLTDKTVIIRPGLPYLDVRTW